MRNWKKWLKAAAIRAVKTVAQTAVATIGTSAVLGEVNWAVVASASAAGGHPVPTHQRGGPAGRKNRIRQERERSSGDCRALFLHAYTAVQVDGN